MKYQDRLSTHLADYKRRVLGILTNGTWTNPRTKQPVEYEHILPEGQREKNIVALSRQRFWSDFIAWGEREPQHVVKLHKDFIHLNSSQALCFNLFYPLIADHGWGATFVTEVLGLPGESPERQWFEYIEDPDEETNYDFFIKLRSGRKLFFEVKLSEGGFGTAKTDARHLDKLARVYEPKLRSLVDHQCLEPEAFCSRYQLLRNMCHLGSRDHMLFLVVPRANESLQPAMRELPEITARALKGRVHVLYLEDLIVTMRALLRDAGGLLKEHYDEVGLKYLILGAAS